MTQVYKPGDRIFDRIEVLEYIGDGGVGQVYRTRLGADEYAVKVLDPDLVSPDADAKALRETLLRNVPVDTILVRVRDVRSDGKRMHIIEVSKQGFDAVAPAVVALAQAEGLWAHAASVSQRQRWAQEGLQ